MTIKITHAILVGLSLIAIMPARAEIASKEYVEDYINEEIGGFGNVLDEFDEHISNNSKAISRYKQPYEGFLVTDSSGDVKIATGGYITNDKVASSAAIEMGKIALPTPPAACNTKGCMLMFYDGKYVWELMERGTNESVSTTGYVSATATTTNTSEPFANDVGCARYNGQWTGETCLVH